MIKTRAESGAGQTSAIMKPTTTLVSIAVVAAAVLLYVNRERVSLFLSSARRVLLLKGLVFGIPPDKFDEALEKATELIASKGITTVCWDGDKYTYPGADGAPPAQSFSRLLPMLQELFPRLEFIYFKKEGGAKGLIEGGEIKADAHGNVLGPFPFLSAASTMIAAEGGPPLPPPKTGRYYGVEFKNVEKWYDLGLRGMRYIKSSLGVASVEVLVFGLGGVVKKENEKVSEQPDLYPDRSFTMIEVKRE